MQKRPQFISFFLIFGVCLVLLWMRVYRLDQVGLYDFDSVKNHLIIQEIAKGNFENVFYHGSPLFFLFYGILAALISTDYLFLEYVGAVLNLLTIGASIRYLLLFWDQRVSLHSIIGLFLFVGMGFFMINSSRYLSIENLSGLLFLFFLFAYLDSFSADQVQKIYLSALLFGLFYTSNYKGVLFVPIMVLLEFFFRKDTLSWRVYIRALGVAFLPLMFCVIVGGIFGVAYLRYPAIIYLSLTSTSSGNFGSQFAPDFFYYFKYFFFYENPLLFIGLLAWGFCNVSQDVSFKPRSFLALQYIVLAYFVLMSLLLKAPRGLSFIYPLIYGMAWIGIQSLVNTYFSQFKGVKILSSLLIGLSLGLQYYRVDQNIYQYSQTNYDHLLEYLIDQEILKVASPISMNLVPFLKNQGPKQIDLAIAWDIQDLKQLKQKGFHYIVVDAYHQITGFQVFDTLDTIKPIQAWPEKTLCAPMLYLEHSEFTRSSFEQSLRKRREIMAKPYQLRIIKNPF